jgi:hypothetical protein
VKNLLSTVFAVASCAAAAQVAGQDLDLMVKWTAAEVVHYDVTMEFAGEGQILKEGGQFRTAPVTDRVEVAFDWNQNEMKLVGTPVIKNFPSTKGDMPPDKREGCPAPRVTGGTYDYINVTAVTSVEYNPALQFTATRSFAAGTIPAFDDQERCTQSIDSPAATERVELGLLVLPAMYLGMPAAGGQGIQVDAAKSTIKSVDQGWTNTYKLSIK